MSGLLEKDICLLLKGHRNTMILFLMICVFLGLSQTDTFILGYFPFLMIVLLIGTLSCDEADNGLPFLFTLPIDRKLYIREIPVLRGRNRSIVCPRLGVIPGIPAGARRFECIWCSLGKCGNDTGLSGGIFHHHFHHDSGADQMRSRKRTGHDGRNLFSVCRCDSVCAESRRRSDTGSNHGADWHHYGHNSGPGRNFYCRHRGFADFVPDQCRIYGETGILEKTKDVRFHFKT